MTSETTSLTRSTTTRDEWARYLAFLKRPGLPERASAIGGTPLVATLRMLSLDLLVMLGLVLVAGAVLLAGFELPENELAGMELTPLLVFAIVVIAPVSEEIAFRGWLSGRPGHILALVAVGAGFAVMASDLTRSSDDVNFKAISVFVGSLLLAALALLLFRKHGAMRWFARAFPLFFWLSTLAFALVHLFNYEAGPAAILLPLVIPQLVVGSILGYVRVHYGLWASILLHALHNGAAVGAVLLALALSGEV